MDLATDSTKHSKSRMGRILFSYLILLQTIVPLNAQHDGAIEIDCLECHGELLESPVTHEFVAEGTCSACHEFNLDTRGPKLMY